MVTKQEIERLAVVETEIKNVDRKIDAIDNKLDLFITTANDKYAGKSQVKDQEIRIRILEKAYYIGIGILIVIQILVGVLL